MEFINVNNFLKGLFAKDGEQHRISDEFVTVLHNMDLSVTGKPLVRPGYDYWPDLLGSNSIPSNFPVDAPLPDTSGRDGFRNKIQGLFQYIDPSGNPYIVVIVDGRVYIETYNGSEKQWTCLNPNKNLINTVKNIDRTSYLNLLFLNDVGDDVYYYDSLGYKEGGWVALKNRFIYFAGNKIYFRNYSTLDNIATEELTIAVGSSYEAKSIYDSLVNISYPYVANLQLGYCLRVGNEEAGIYYYVLDNWNNARADDKCQIIKLNSQLIAEDFAEVDMDAIGNILNFDYYKVALLPPGEGHLFLYAKTGVIYKINENNLSVESLDSSDIQGLTPPVVGGANQLSIAVNARGMFVYSYTLPDRSDWWQPIISDVVPGVVPNFPNPYLTDHRSNSWYIWDPQSGLQTTAFYPVYVKARYDSAEGVVGRNIFNYTHRTSILSQFLYAWQDQFGYDLYPNCTSGSYWYNKKVTYLHLNSSRIYITDTIGFDVNKLNVFNYRNNVPDYFLGNLAILYQYWSLGGTFCTPNTEAFTHIPAWTLTYNNNAHETIGAHMAKDNAATTIRRMVGSLGNIFNVPAYIPTFHRNFQYDKDNLKPGTTAVFTNNISNLQRGISAFYLVGAAYNSYTFSSKTTSIYTLLVGIAHDQTLMKESIATLDEGTQFWRYIIPLGKMADINGVQPIHIINDEVYFGTDMVNSVVTPAMNYGKYMKLSIPSKDIQIENSMVSTRKIPVEPGKWLLRDNNKGAGYFSYSNSWLIAGGTSPHNDYTNLETYNANLQFYSKKIIVDTVGANKTDRIVPLGTPKEPVCSLVGDNSSALNTEYSYRYYMVFEFLTGKTTNISVAGEEIFIPDYGPGINSRIRVSDIDLKDINGIDIYSPSSINKIQLYRSELLSGVDNAPENWSEPSLLAVFENFNNEWYHDEKEAIIAVNIGADQVTVLGDLSSKYITGGHIAITDSTGNDGNGHVVSAVFGGVNTVITVDWDLTDATVDGYVRFAKHTFEDYTGTIAYNPFTLGNVTKYPVNDIDMHKGRLVLINKLDEDNSNIIQYSETNLARAVAPDAIRPIESGDGDSLITGKSLGDYYYLFKTSKIYAILGDVKDGQLINIDNKVGTRYKKLVVSFGGMIYFMNDYGIFAIQGQQVTNIMLDRVKNFFDKTRDDAIDFSNMDEGFAEIDIENREILWFVPQLTDDGSPVRNNLVIIYNIDYNYFKTRSYNNNVTNAAYIRNISDDTYEYLFSDYDGHIFKISRSKNDDNKPIQWIFRTKHFNARSNVISKIYKLIKVAGKYLTNIRITYWIDGERYMGDISYRTDVPTMSEALVKVWSRGRANTIAIEVSGEALNNAPIEIDEILIGLERSGGLR